MPNPLSTLVEKHLGAGFMPRVKQFACGLASDFWKDGVEFPLARRAGPAVAAPSLTQAALAKPGEAKKKGPSHPLWHAMPGEISEKMWGAGFTMPGTDVIADAFIKPLGLSKTMSVLDLSAGLGNHIRKAADGTGAYVTSLDPDAAMAAHVMDITVKAGKARQAPVTFYDTAHFQVDRAYDCVLARETFYRIADKTAFFKVIGDACKPKAQLAFTDYIVDPENREQPAIVGWQASEKDATPLGVVEMAEAWVKVGFNLRVSEDLSEYYAKEVASGLKRFAVFLASGVHPDPETKKSILRRIELWTHRMAAMEQGMKFYRFYGTKP